MNTRTWLAAAALLACGALLWLGSSSRGSGSGRDDDRRAAASPADRDAGAATGHEEETSTSPTHLEAPTRSGDADSTPRRVAQAPDFGDDGDAPAGASEPCELESPSSGTSGTSVEAPRVAGSIRGTLVREGGPWTDETLPRGNTVILDLVELRAPHESRRGVLEVKPDATGGRELWFTFDDLPEGEYELTLSALGSWRWAPVSLRVRPPASGIVFTRYDKDPKLPLAFEVTDARTGAPLTSFQSRHVQLTPSVDAGVFLQTGPLDADAFPIDARFQWTVWADGYAAAFGDETAFTRRDDRRVAQVKLEPGWSTRVLVLAKDPLARQVRGAEILLDGVRAGFTDAAGMLSVRAPARPASLLVRLDGWTMQNDPLAPFLGKTAEQRAHTTIVYLTR